jgi:hypothetical protein
MSAGDKPWRIHCGKSSPTHGFSKRVTAINWANAHRRHGDMHVAHVRTGEAWLRRGGVWVKDEFGVTSQAVARPQAEIAPELEQDNYWWDRI